MLPRAYKFHTALLALLSLYGSGDSTPVVEYDKGQRYEEYSVEHEISTVQARNAALSIDLRSVTPPPGCQTCTKDELLYCLGPELISDHCCCDRRYHEFLSFIPHTCYQGPQMCKPIVGDCAAYTKLRTCCCNEPAISKWKKKLSGSASGANKLTVMALTLLSVLLVAFKELY